MPDSTPIRVVVADDHPGFRRAARALLEAYDDFAVVGEAVDGEEVVDVARRLRAGVVLMDLRMPLLDGIEATRALLAAVPDVRVVAWTGSHDAERAQRALDAGAVACVLKDAPAETLLAALRDAGSSARPGAARA
jgi:DNA-binding NarL/FixJ family response regulator